MLDYEKAYKEAIEKLRILQRSWSATQNRAAKEIAEAFHELRESEDERIRKELLEEIEFITPHDDETDSEGLILPSYHARIDRYKSYLEKQKDQKPESCDCSRDEESYTNGIHHVLMNPEAYGLIKQKPAEWSEEDKKNLQGVIDEIEANKNTAPSYDIPTYDRFLSWLKSLRHRPQPHWKPSEEQMEEYSYWYKNFIESGLASPSSKAVNVLGELLEQLKKL